MCVPTFKWSTPTVNPCQAYNYPIAFNANGTLPSFIMDGRLLKMQQPFSSLLTEKSVQWTLSDAPNNNNSNKANPIHNPPSFSRNVFIRYLNLNHMIHSIRIFNHVDNVTIKCLAERAIVAETFHRNHLKMHR